MITSQGFIVQAHWPELPGNPDQKQRTRNRITSTRENWEHLGKTRNIWGELETSGENKEHLGRTRNIWGELGTSGENKKHLGRSGNIWGVLGTSGEN